MTTKRLAVFAAVSVALMTALTWAVVTRHGPLPGDLPVHDWSVRHRPGPVKDFAIIITDSGIGVFPYAMVAVTGILAGSPGGDRLLRAVGGMLFLAAGQAVRFGLVHWTGRARPPTADWAAPGAGLAFPSGHSTTSALAAGLVIWAAAGLSSRALRAVIIAAACIWAFAVGLTRIYLGVHWMTDVVGAWLLAASLVSLAALARARMRRR